jgi:hypothetical protein
MSAHDEARDILDRLIQIPDLDPGITATFRQARAAIDLIHAEWQMYSAQHALIVGSINTNTIDGMYQLITPPTNQLMSFGMDTNDDAFRGPMFRMMGEDFPGVHELQRTIEMVNDASREDPDLVNDVTILTIVYLRAMFLVLLKLASFNFYCAHGPELTNYFAHGHHDCPITNDAMNLQNSCMLPCTHVFSKTGMAGWARTCIKAGKPISCPTCRYRTTFGYIDCNDPQYAKIRHYTPTQEQLSSAGPAPAGGGYKRKTMSKNKKHKMRKSRKARKSRKSRKSSRKH